MPVTPSAETFERLATQGNLIPVYREIMADLDTPVSAFLKLTAAPHRGAFLLESVAGGEKWARYSFLGANPHLIIRGRGDQVTLEEHGQTRPLEVDGNPLLAVQAFMQRYQPVAVDGLPPFAGGAVGFVAYDMVRYFENIPIQLQREGDTALDLDDFCFMLTDRMVVFDAVRQVIQVVAYVHIDGLDQGQRATAYEAACATIDDTVERLHQPLPPAPPKTTAAAAPDDQPLTSNITPEAYRQAVETAQEYIRAGDIFQVVLSQRFQVPLSCTPLDLYRALRRINPSPYMYYLALDDTYVVGASPELLVRTQQGQVALRPIAGTRPRGADAAEDQRLQDELKDDAKECAEHLMLVDLGRNDVGRVARTGTVVLDDFMVVEKYSHVMHLVSNVTGQLAPGLDAFDVLISCFPAGTLSGAPKIRAMQIIEELEPASRGLYGGAVGYFAYDGSSDMAINIRTVMVKHGTAYLQAGAGIVADSVPHQEYEETRAKAAAMVRAIHTANRGLAS